MDQSCTEFRKTEIWKERNKDMKDPFCLSAFSSRFPDYYSILKEKKMQRKCMRWVAVYDIENTYKIAPDTSVFYSVYL